MRQGWENPVITVAQKCVDASTVEHMLQFDASLARYYQESRPNLFLRSKLEEFVSLHEKLYKNGHFLTAEKSKDFLKSCDENIMRIKQNGHQFLGGDAIIGMDIYDSPDDVITDIEEQLQVESPQSLWFIGKLDHIEIAKLLVLTTIYNVVSTDTKRRGYSNLLSAFNEAKEVYQTDLSMDVRLSIHSVMKLHRTRWFKDNIIGCLLSKLILPSSARHLNRLGFFKHCTDKPYQEPRYTAQSEEDCILDIKPTP